MYLKFNEYFAAGQKFYLAENGHTELDPRPLQLGTVQLPTRGETQQFVYFDVDGTLSYESGYWNLPSLKSAQWRASTLLNHLHPTELCGSDTDTLPEKNNIQDLVDTSNYAHLFFFVMGYFENSDFLLQWPTFFRPGIFQLYDQLIQNPQLHATILTNNPSNTVKVLHLALMFRYIQKYDLVDYFGKDENTQSSPLPLKEWFVNKNPEHKVVPNKYADQHRLLIDNNIRFRGLQNQLLVSTYEQRYHICIFRLRPDEQKRIRYRLEEIHWSTTDEEEPILFSTETDEQIFSPEDLLNGMQMRVRNVGTETKIFHYPPPNYSDDTADMRIFIQMLGF